MLAGTLAFVLGCACLLHLATLPQIESVLLLPVIYLLSLRYRFLKLFFFFSLGFCWALIRLDYSINPVLDKSQLEKDNLIIGTVSSLIVSDDRLTRFVISDVSIINKSNIEERIKGKVRVSWYNTKQEIIPGERWQLSVKLKRPYSFMNPGGFDYEAWMLRQAIRYIAYVKSNNNQIISKTESYPIQRIRNHISESLQTNLKQPLLGFAMALSLGDRSLLDKEMRKTLSNTGTSHLIAISGLHLSLITGLVYFLSLFLTRQAVFITNHIPAPYTASVMSFMAGLSYAAMAGFSLPTQRALIMIAVFLYSQVSARQYRAMDIISLAVFFILILDPMSVIAVDFWLSFSAVLLILYLVRFRYNHHPRIVEWLRIQFCLSLAMMPLLAYWFYQIPVFSVVANIIAIPVIGLVIVPLLLTGVVFIFINDYVSDVLFILIDLINQNIWVILNFLASYSESQVVIGEVGLISLLLAMSGIIILFSPTGMFIRSTGIVWLLPLLIPNLNMPEKDEFNFTLLDVGQGLAAVIQTQNDVLVYDSGAKFSDRFNAGSAVLIPYLKSSGIKRLSTLVISHGDNDHIGGANAILEAYPSTKVMTSVPDKLSQFSSMACDKNQSWNWQGVQFDMLHPGDGNFSGNNASCVLKVSSKYGSVLLTGDIEHEAESILIKEKNPLLGSDILIVPHHGSRTSSTLEFIKQVDPKYAFFPVGYRNRFGFPKQDIIGRYEQLGIKIKTTYKTGAIGVKFRKSGTKMLEYRKQAKRPWHFEVE